MKQIPNLFTLLNLVFGCIAIVCILQPGETIVLLSPEGFTDVNLPERIALASIFIFAAAVVDFLDGFVARLFKATSPMGAQLDSLADMVSFGVAPGLILYQLLRISFARDVNGLDISAVYLLPALLVPCCAAWRLARFNISTDQDYGFKGLPAPAAGLTIASFPLIMHYQQFNLQDLFLQSWVLYLTIIVISVFMVSRLRLLGLKFKDWTWANNMPKYLLVIFGIIAAILLKWVAIPVILVVYVLLSLLFKNKTA